MAYERSNPKTKKALKELVATGKAYAFQPGGLFPLATGKTVIEGPHFPKPHRWYASVEVDDDGRIVRVIS